jgi:segregation and condensation protein A
MRLIFPSTQLRDVPVSAGPFSGPLDLLLQLVESRQLPITAVSLRAVTEQFLAALETVEAHRPELLADFLVVASRLTVLKARALLPHHDVADEDAASLVQDLERYRAFRDAAAWLQARAAAGLRCWTRPALPRAPRAAPSGDPDQLLRALARWARRQRPVALPLRWTPVVSLTAMIARIRERLAGHRTFRELLGARPTRPEVVAGLLALLVLARRRVVTLEQAEPFGEIWVQRTDEHGTS